MPGAFPLLTLERSFAFARLISDAPSRLRQASTLSAIKEGVGKTKSKSSLRFSANGPRSRLSHPAPFKPWKTQPASSVLDRGGLNISKKRAGSTEAYKSNRSRVVGLDENDLALQQHVSIPYVTPVSEFLYGRSVVEAALKARRRKLHKLYYSKGLGATSTDEAGADLLLRLAGSRGVPVQPLHGADAPRLLERMTKGRPHNGFVLDASPLMKLPVTSLLRSDPASGQLQIELGPQSSEERELNGQASVLQYLSRGTRYPFVLFLDGIIDPGNLGAILRSASFLGVDAVVVSGHCAPLSPVVLKASAGAAETLPLLSVRKTGSFVESSRKHGWQFYAAVPPETKQDYPLKFSQTIASLDRPLRKHPCVLMLGGEGPGLWKDLILKSNCLLTIQGRRPTNAGVDSLNVSAAAALICEAFLGPTFNMANELWE